MEEILIRYLHFLGFIGLISALVAEHLILSSQTTREQLKRVATLDSIAGIAALAIIIAGLLLWFVVGKPKEYYFSNYLFHLKLTLFIVAAGLAAFVTRYLSQTLKQTASNQEQIIQVPKSIRLVIRIQLLVLLVIPLLAISLSRGMGHLGG